MHRLIHTERPDELPEDFGDHQRTAGDPHLHGLLRGTPSAAVEPARATDLSRLVHEMRRLLRAVCPPSLHVRFELAEGLPAVQAESVRLRQALTHLVAAAACRAVSHQWSLTIRTRVLAVPALSAAGPAAPALELLLGSESGQALALLRWAVVSQARGRGRGANLLHASTVQQTLHALRCTVNFVRLPGEGVAAQLLFPAAQ